MPRIPGRLVAVKFPAIRPVIIIETPEVVSRRFKWRLHDTARCTICCTTGWTNIYTMQPVVGLQRVAQPVVATGCAIGCLRSFMVTVFYPRRVPY